MVRFQTVLDGFGHTALRLGIGIALGLFLLIPTSLALMVIQWADLGMPVHIAAEVLFWAANSAFVIGICCHALTDHFSRRKQNASHAATTPTQPPRPEPVDWVRRG